MIHALKSESGGEYWMVGIIGDEHEVGDLIDEVAVIGGPSDLMNFCRARARHRTHPFIHARSLRRSVLRGDGRLRARRRADPNAGAVRTADGPRAGRACRQQLTVVLPSTKVTGSSSYPALKRIPCGERRADRVRPVHGSAAVRRAGDLHRLSRPDLYGQERVGLNGRPFRVYKFRTMIPNAEQATGAVFSDKADPRKLASGSSAQDAHRRAAAVSSTSSVVT
ncbi:MAG: hypothetical protein HND48_13720 [Chloroflexi bacterium]|nr:hypothetical protein [Chloroflexota bacterium]